MCTACHPLKALPIIKQNWKLMKRDCSFRKQQANITASVELQWGRSMNQHYSKQTEHSIFYPGLQGPSKAHSAANANVNNEKWIH